MSLCTFVFNPTTPANASIVQESEPNNDYTTADNLSLNTWVKGTIERLIPLTQHAISTRFVSRIMFFTPRRIFHLSVILI